MQHLRNCKELNKTDFVKVEEHETMGNRFATYRGEDNYVYVYYTACTGKMRVITGPTAELAKLSYQSDAELKYTPYISSVPQPDNGLGLILRLPDGRFIVCDAPIMIELPYALRNNKDQMVEDI